MTELFGGAGRYRALRCLLEDANRWFGTRELANAADIDAGNTSRWLRRWADLGLLDRRTEHGATVFRVSKDPGLVPLRVLLQQDSQMAQVLTAALDDFKGNVEAAAIFGSAAHGEIHVGSDIDLLLIGPRSRLLAQAHFKPAGRTLQRPVNVQAFTLRAWEDAIASGDAFVHDILARPVVILKGVLRAELHL